MVCINSVHRNIFSVLGDVVEVQIKQISPAKTIIVPSTKQVDFSYNNKECKVTYSPLFSASSSVRYSPAYTPTKLIPGIFLGPANTPIGR